MTLQENRKNYASCSFLAGFSPWKFPRGHFNCWTPNFQRRLNHPFKSLVNWAENLQKSPTTQTSGKTERRKKTCVMCNMWTKIDFFFIYCTLLPLTWLVIPNNKTSIFDRNRKNSLLKFASTKILFLFFLLFLLKICASKHEEIRISFSTPLKQNKTVTLVPNRLFTFNLCCCKLGQSGQ